MLNSLRIDEIGQESTMDLNEQELIQRRKAKQKRAVRSRAHRVGIFFASPYAAVVCMLVALGSIVGFWRGVPDWALLTLGIGAVIIIVVAGFFYRATKK